MRKLNDSAKDKGFDKEVDALERQYAGRWNKDKRC